MNTTFSGGNDISAPKEWDKQLYTLPIQECDTIDGGMYFKPGKIILYMHDGIYFTVVTFITVGYGDINPTTVYSKIWVIGLILITFTLIPTKLAEILTLMNSQSRYRRLYYKHSEIEHVVVTGNVSKEAIKDFCIELFHEDHSEGSQGTNAVIIQNKDPKPEVELFMDGYQKNMFYIAGDPLKFEDMIKRCELHKASACIILTNKNSQNSNEEDFRNILIALAVKKMVYDELRDQKEENSANIKLCMQLIKPESKDLYFKSLNLSPLQDQLIIVEEIKMNLLAKSCFAPGLIAMISNLIASAGDPNLDLIKEDWFADYSEGMGHEIYRVDILREDYGDDITFSKAADIGYSEFGVIVFALEIQSKENTN